MAKEEKKVKKVGLIINAFVKDGKVDEVTMGAHLGNGALTFDEDEGVFNGFSHFRPESRVPVVFDIENLGEPSVVEVQAEGMHETDVRFNALDFLDEKEKLEALSDDEKSDLRDIGILELRQIAADAQGHKWTPLEDAVIAILAHEKGATYGDGDIHLPVPGMAHNTKPGVGSVTHAYVSLSVGNYDFSDLDEGFIAEIKPCADGRTLYQYSWTGVPAYVLDEPK